MPSHDQSAAFAVAVHRRAVRRSLPRMLALGLTATLVFAPSAAAGTNVFITDFAFGPTKVSGPQGVQVDWHNNGSYTHSVTSDKSEATTPKLDYWPRHDLSPGTQFDLTFIAAGTFFYHCSLHSSMQGKVKVPVLVSNTGLSVTVTTATQDFARSDPFRHVIRWRMNSGPWQTINTRRAQKSFSVPAHGTFQFAAAVRRKSNGAQSGWSKVVTRTIT